MGLYINSVTEECRRSRGLATTVKLSRLDKKSSEKCSTDLKFCHIFFHDVHQIPMRIIPLSTSQFERKKQIHMDYGTLTETSTIIDEEQVQAKVSLFQKIRNAVSWFITSTLVVHCILVFVQMLYAGFGMIGGTATKSISPFVFAMFRLTLMMVSFNCISFFVDHSYWRKKIDESSIHYGDACCGRNLIPNWSDGLTMGVLGLLVCFNVFSYITAVSLTDYTIGMSHLGSGSVHMLTHSV